MVARDLGVFDFLEAAVAALDRLEPDLWPVVFRESTSPKPILVGLSLDVLERGIGAVGSIRIPDFIWHAVAPNDVLSVSTRALPGIQNISPEGLVMARALVRDGVLTRCPSNLPPNGWLLPVPKNSEKASMIVHLVQFNKQHANRPPSFTLPVVEDLAFLIELHYLRAGQGCLAFSEEVGRYLCDPFLRALDDLRLEAPEGAPLLACHVDLKNAFWSLRLPDAFKQTFRVSIDGQTFAFNCLHFGWQYSPVICQTVLGYLLQGLDLVSVLVLHYLDDFLVLGFGAGNVRSAAARLCDLLGREGAIISPKSILEPVPSIVWLGKQLVLSGAGQGVFVVTNQWIVLLGLWLRVALLPLSRKLARRVFGRFSWALRPQVGACPFLAGWWSHVMWGSSFLPSAPLKLVHSLLHCLVMSRRGWTPRRVDSPSSAGRGLVFVDAAFDLDRFKVGLWGPALGGRVFRCGHEVLTQQEAELDSLVQGLSFIVNVGWPVFRLVGDNASSIGQMAGMRARSGLKRHNRNLRRAFYLLQRSDSTVFLEWVPGDLNPADCFSRIDGDFGGDFAAAGLAAWDRFRSLQAFPALPCPVWVANLPKGRTAMDRQLAECPVGAVS